MKKYIAVLLFFFCFFHAYTQDSFCNKIEKLIKVGQNHHFKKIAIDSEFEILVEKLFFENLDPYHLLFTVEDLNELKQIHDLKEQDCKWYGMVHERLKINLLFIGEILNELQNIELDFQKDEKFEIPKYPLGVSKDKFKNHWKRYLKYRILNELDIESASSPDLNKHKSQVLDKLNCRIEKLNINENNLGDLYLNCITSAFDPHSSYISSKQASLFLEELKGNNKSYGLVVSSKNDEVIVAKILPGSSAWNSNAINEGDIILQLETAEGDKFDFSCLGQLECQEVLLQQDGKITLEIRKANNQSKKVSITKETLSESEDNIQSFILNKENKVAYIYLPSFYSGEEFSYQQPAGCAKDLAKELFKLKRENVEALILDLRNNGGGSMLEALHMAGLFIDYGSLIILEDRNQNHEVIKDGNRGVLFDKPVIVLINNQSASASEMLAGVLQDYNRALIVGSRSFGKSSSQVFYDLDGNLFDGVFDTKKDLVKLTTGLFYRVTTASHQQSGIVPNIRLPELFESTNPKESNYPNALANAISEKTTTFKALDAVGFDALEEKWNRQVEKSDYFINILNLSSSVEKDQNEHSVSLNLNNYLSYHQMKQKLIEQVEKREHIYFDQVNLPDYRQSLDHSNAYKMEENEKRLKSISNDQYVIFSFQIIQDMINLKQ